MTLSLLAALVVSACALQPAEKSPDKPETPTIKTIAESSDYKATARYDDVNAFLKELAARSDLVRLSNIGKSGEDREIPLAIIADPPISKPEEAKKSGKLVVLA